MSLISETYFRVDDTAWDYRGQFGMLLELCAILL